MLRANIRISNGMDKKILIIPIVVALLGLVIGGCRTVRQVQGEKLELSRRFEMHLDSTSHKWVVHRLTTYQGGEVASVEEQEQHAVETVTKLIRDTIYVYAVDTLYIYKDATPVVEVAKSAGHTARLVAIVVVLLGALGVCSWLAIRYGWLR